MGLGYVGVAQAVWGEEVRLRARNYSVTRSVVKDLGVNIVGCCLQSAGTVGISKGVEGSSS